MKNCVLYKAEWTENLTPVFLVGSPRSGTTWLQAMIGSHPLIMTGVETHYFRAIKNFLDSSMKSTGTRTGLGAYLTKEQVITIVREIFWSIISNLPEPQHTPKYFLEKSPGHCFYSGEILSVFPNAKFIHLIRDGRMVVNSMLEISKRPWGYWAPNTVEQAALRWKKSVLAGREIINQVPSKDHYIEIKYEKVRKSPKNFLRLLFDWLNLPIKDFELDFIIDDNSLETMHRKNRVEFSSISAPKFDGKKEIRDPKEVRRKGNYESGDYGLNDQQKKYVDYLVGGLLLDLEYDDVINRFSIFEKMSYFSLKRKILEWKKSEFIRNLIS
jgi:hypothetical protein